MNVKAHIYETSALSARQMLGQRLQDIQEEAKKANKRSSSNVESGVSVASSITKRLLDDLENPLDPKNQYFAILE